MNASNPYKTLIRYDQVADQEDGAIRRYIGFVQAKNLLSLFDDVKLDANPRSAKANQVVADIIESVREDPKNFQFKTKGILLGTSTYAELDRRRFELHFDDPAYEGLLDGGHNMLALGIYLLSKVMDAKDIGKIKLWEDMKAAWEVNREAVYALRDTLEFKLPVELLVPSNPDNAQIVSDFRMALIDVCAARNNNAQLTTEAKANQLGFYDEIRQRLERVNPGIAQRIEWKSNEWDNTSRKPIKVRDLLALAWIPLTVLEEHGLLPNKTENGTPLNFQVLPQNIYRNKGELSKLFDKLMDHPDVSKAKNGARHELHNVAIGSAFDILVALPALYDQIFLDMGDAYNEETKGKFGRINEVGMPKHGAPAPYTQAVSKYRVPDGYIVPFLYGLKALMTVKDGKVGWLVDDPADFLRRHMRALVGAFKMPMEMAGFDPQKIAKSPESYRFMVGEVEKALLKEQHSKSIAA